MGMNMTTRRNRVLERELLELLGGDSFIKVGILGKPEGNSPKASDKKKYRDSKGVVKTDNSISNVEVAVLHEFGYGPFPKRSFMVSTIAKKKVQNNINKAFTENYRQKNDVNEALRYAGTYLVGAIKQTFRSNDWPGLKDPTRGRKRGVAIGPIQARPLIDTGQLRASISFQLIRSSPQAEAKTKRALRR